MRSTLVVLLLLIVQAFEARVCPTLCCEDPNEVYLICGSLCERTCTNLYDCDLCPAVCVSGCFCKDGYVRDSLGTCIPACDCPILTTTLAPTTTKKKPLKCKPPTTTTTEAPCSCTTTTEAPCLCSTTTVAPCA
ncbi:AAEL000356-PA [Aedes aegypti]|uniref:AAEL000356-PA n=1 Tax=Aedes aegypti TaxID=7159 RepID=Q17PL3_AEDAE|nr:AAEL000356-PA [Aedes aegypti]